MMKRWISSVVLSAMLVTSFGSFSAYAAEDGAMQTADDYILHYSYQKDGTTMVPLRGFAEVLGAEVTWNFLTETAAVTLGEHTLRLKENAAEMTVDGTVTILPKATETKKGSMYAPVRAVAEGLGFAVHWDEEMQRVHLAEGTPKEQEKEEKVVDLGHLYPVVSVSASGDDGNIPEGTLDRNYETRWSNDESGGYITLEMDAVHPVAYIGVACYKGDERKQTLSVQISTDGTNFKEVVTKYVMPEFTNSMLPVDLGATYDAKFVRILGYGNTSNEWNSITEISIYGPMEDGSMPVATDGPAVANSIESLTDEQRAALEKLDTRFEGLDEWFANLYHHEDGGFYMAMSGRDDPMIECGLEMTFYALSCITSYSDASVVPEHVKARFIDYITERQDPESGLFIDHQGPVNDRETARNQAAVMGWVNSWGVELPYVHPQQKAKTESAGTSSTDTAVMPSYMASVDSYIDWVENNWDWDNNSWTAGDQTQQSLNYINYLPEDQRDAYKKALLKWLEDRQFEDTGYWAPNLNFNSVSGAFKVGLIYGVLGEKIPNVEKVMETTLQAMETIYPDVAHYVRNPISLLQQIAAYGLEYEERIRQAVTDNIESICGWMDQFLAPDGGFAQYHGKSMSNFGGIYGTHQLWEGDVDSTLMILIARKGVYELMGVKAPLLKFDPDFWNWIDGSVETPSCYRDISALEGGDAAEYRLDFEEMPFGALDGTEFGGSSSTGMDAQIVKDGDRIDNRCLSLTYDGSLSLGPDFYIGDADSFDVLYRPGKVTDVAVEFDVKMKNMANTNNCHIDLGGSRAYMLNIYQTSMSTRIDDANVNYGGIFTRLNENEWYRVRVEYHTGATKNDFMAKVYVDGELVSSNKNYANCLIATPGNAYGGLYLTWYRAGKGTVMLDNLVMTKQ